MTSSNPFSYSECFSDRVLNRVPETLQIKGRGDSEVLLIVRLLSGAINVGHISSAKNYKQRENYFLSDLRGYAQSWDRNFPGLIAENYSAEQFAEYLESTKGINRKFYKNILGELSYYFHYQKKGVHSSAFIFLYRTLEHIAYALPLTYVSKTEDFSKTFNFLKDLVSSDKNANELGFFKSFIITMYDGDPISESSIDFPIAVDTESEQKKIFNLLYRLCKGGWLAESTENPRVLSLKFTEVGGFIQTIRNRFFHYMNGGARNIESSNISDIDTLFSLVNKKCLYWIATVFLAVISHNAIEFEKMKARIAQ